MSHSMITSLLYVNLNDKRDVVKRAKSKEGRYATMYSFLDDLLVAHDSGPGVFVKGTDAGPFLKLFGWVISN